VVIVSGTRLPAEPYPGRPISDIRGQPAPNGRGGRTLIMATHDEELARQVADRIIRLKDGRVVS
jgi:predicted ABC-type transport system involved in lysophospholipase L1 biosynthesis ATPase subunit